MKLSNRIRTMVSLIDEDYVADIGSDHGLLPISLIKEKRAGKVLATDISEKSLNKLKRNLSNESYPIDLFVSDGLEGLERPYPDLVVISGMGGRLIIDILDKDLEKSLAINKFILQANTVVDELRSYLINNGFAITDENSCLDENRFYVIISARPGRSEAYSQAHLQYGKILLEKRDKLTYKKIIKDKKRLEGILQDLVSKEKDESRQEEIYGHLKLIEEALSYYETI